MSMKAEELVILAQKVFEYNIYALYYIIQVYVRVLVTYNVFEHTPHYMCMCVSLCV